MNDDPLGSVFSISRVNPAFTEDDSSARPQRPAGTAGSSSGYESGSSSPLSHTWDDQPAPGVPGQALDGVRELSESMSRSPTLLAVCRALEAGARRDSGGLVGGGGEAGRCRLYAPAWTQYLGCGIAPGDVTLRPKGFEEVHDLTLDEEAAQRLLALVERGTRQRCCCRALTALLAALLFLSLLVGLSWAVSRGRHLFGAI